METNLLRPSTISLSLSQFFVGQVISLHDSEEGLTNFSCVGHPSLQDRDKYKSKDKDKDKDNDNNKDKDKDKYKDKDKDKDKDKVTERPNMCYIFENDMTQGCQI